MIPAPSPTFVATWRSLEKREQRQIRRLVRLGRPVPDGKSDLAAQYAVFQASRPWARIFWFWFIPGIALAITIAWTIHPIVVGVVLVLGAQAIVAHHHVVSLVKRGTPAEQT